MYYQGIDRVIREVLSDGLEGAWRIGATLPMAVTLKRDGAPLAALKGDGPLRLFYGREIGIGQLLYDGTRWTGQFLLRPGLGNRTADHVLSPQDSEVPGSEYLDSREPFAVSENQQGQLVFRKIVKTTARK